MFVLTFLELAAAASSSSSVSQTTVMATATADPTSYWITAMGDASGIQAHYQQKFTRYFSEIHSPLSGKIGLGRISGDAGRSREYPLKTAPEADALYQVASDDEASSGTVPAVTSGLLRQALDTDSRGHLKTSDAGWTSIAAVAGEASTWYGPTVTQASIDTPVGSQSSEGHYGGTYTFPIYTLGGTYQAQSTVPVTAEGSPYKTMTIMVDGSVVTSGDNDDSSSTSASDSSSSVTKAAAAADTASVTSDSTATDTTATQNTPAAATATNTAATNTAATNTAATNTAATAATNTAATNTAATAATNTAATNTAATNTAATAATNTATTAAAADAAGAAGVAPAAPAPAAANP